MGSTDGKNGGAEQKPPAVARIGTRFMKRADAAAARRRAGRTAPPRPVPPPRVPVEPNAESPPDGPAAVAAAAVVGVVATAPWLFGSAGSLHVAASAAALAAVAAVVTPWRGAGPVPAMTLPLAGLLGVAAAQFLSGVTGDDLETDGGGLGRHLVPVTVCAAATREAAASLAAGLLGLLIAARAGATPAGRRVVWWGVAGTAAAFAVVGLAGRLGRAAEFGFVGVLEGDNGLTGPFFAGFNRNHAAQLLNVGLAATVGLLAAGGGRAAVVCGATIAAGLVVTGSRGGLAAVPAGLLLAAAGLALVRPGGLGSGETDGPDLRRAGRVCVAASGVVAAGVAFALWQFDLGQTGLGRLDESRKSTLTEEISGRWEHWTDAVKVAGDLPAFGAGLGTHRFATLPYQSRPVGGWFTHADNQYVETLVETGFVGLALLALAGVGLLWGVRRAGRAGAADAVAAAAYAAGALGVQAGFDYGITRPPVLFAAAAVFGAACGAGAAGGVRRGVAGRGAAAAFVLLLAAAGGWAAREQALAAPAAPHRELGTVDGDAADWPRARVEAEIARLAAAVAGRPDDVEARVTLARLLMRRYRDAAAAGLSADPRTAGLPEDTRRRLADPGFGAFVAAGPDGPALLAQMRADPLVRETLAPAFDHLAAARAACPFVPRLDWHLSRVAWAVPDEDPTGRRFLTAVPRTAPSDALAQRSAARRAERLGLSEVADDLWRTALALDPAGAAAVAGTLADADDRLDDGATARFLALLPPAPAGRAAAAVAVMTKFPPLAVAVAEELSANGGELPAAERADVLRLVGRPAEAVAALREHLAGSPRDLPARVRLVGWLLEDGEFDAAAEQIAVAEAVAPGAAGLAGLPDRLRRARKAATAWND